MSQRPPPERAPRLAALIRVLWPSEALGLLRDGESRVLQGIARVAHAYGANEPFSYDDTSAGLVLLGSDAPKRGLAAALSIWGRLVAELSLDARISVGVSAKDDRPARASRWESDVALGERLAKAAPPGSILVTEDIARDLPDDFATTLEPWEGDVETGTEVFRALASGAQKVGSKAPEKSLRDSLRAEALAPSWGLVRLPGFARWRRDPPPVEMDEVFRLPGLVPAPRAPSASPPPSSLELGVAPSDAGGASSLGAILMGRRRFVVLGDAGSGKTTLLRWLARTAAHGRAAVLRGLGEDARLTPVFASFADLATQGLGRGEVTLERALALDLARRMPGYLPTGAEQVSDLLSDPNTLLLLDGMDEVSSAARRSVRAAVAEFLVRCPSPRCILSARSAGFVDPGIAAGPIFRLAPLDRDGIEGVAGALFEALRRADNDADLAEDARDDIDRFMKAIDADDHLRELAGMPLSLALLVAAQRSDGLVPRQRVRVYDMVARTLSETWELARRGPRRPTDERAALSYEEEAVFVLGRVALALLEEHPNGSAPRDFFLSRIEQTLIRRGEKTQRARLAAEDFFGRAAERAGLLVERGGDTWGFLHLAIAEHLAVAALAAEERLEDKMRGWLFDPARTDTLRLGIAYTRTIQGRPAAAVHLTKQAFEATVEGEDAYVTTILQKQIPRAGLLLVETWDALAADDRQRFAQAIADWSTKMPIDVAELGLRGLRGGDVGTAVARGVEPSLFDETRAIFAASVLRVLQAPETIDALTRLLSQSKDSSVLAMTALALFETLPEPDAQAAEAVFLMSSDLPPYLQEQARKRAFSRILPEKWPDIAREVAKQGDLLLVQFVLRHIALRDAEESRALAKKLLPKKDAKTFEWGTGERDSIGAMPLEEVSRLAPARRLYALGFLLAAGRIETVRAVAEVMLVETQADQAAGHWLLLMIGDERGLRPMESELATLRDKRKRDRRRLYELAVALLFTPDPAAGKGLREMAEVFPNAFAPAAALLLRGDKAFLARVLEGLPRATPDERALAIGALWIASDLYPPGSEDVRFLRGTSRPGLS